MCTRRRIKQSGALGKTQGAPAYSVIKFINKKFLEVLYVLHLLLPYAFISKIYYTNVTNFRICVKMTNSYLLLIIVHI